ncbi:MAG TPA: response regulator [Novimethylophilus sp.]|jgi:signal transduction histidine kinase/DNA-binding response OmpR family regulator|uniref:response regulator n=1 Tax=Novimethylophilus sp. TaxID=2137426 RepID=UPI002F3F8440
MPEKRKPQARHEAQILIVEDSAHQAEQLKHLLEQNHFGVTLAGNGRQALVKLAKSGPQLVIIDIAMPEMDGYELCRAIKSDPQLKHLPVILVTSLSDMRDVPKGLECGADNFLRKPYDEKQLLSRIDYLLINHAIRKDRKMQMGTELHLAGQKHFITAERQQILDLLISTYEEAIRMKAELKVRQQELIEAARYDQTHGEVLRLFNSTSDRTRILQGMLAILAANHPLPASAVYSYDEWSGSYRLEASHPSPDGLSEGFWPGEGALGAAVDEDRCRVISGCDADFFPAADIAVRPVAVIVSPVCRQGRRLAVLLLAAGVAPGERDLAFIERLAGQLGMALHNLQQYSGLQLLAEQLHLRSEEIGGKNAQLEEVRRMKSEFLANMSHELRTPLNAIVGFSEVLRDEIAGPLSARQHEYMTDIFDSSQHLLTVVNDVLDLSRIESCRMVLEGETINIVPLLRSSLSAARKMASAQRIALCLDVPDSVVEIWLDQRKLKRMVYNLLSNAVKFTPQDGSVTLRARIVSREEALRPVEGWPELRMPLPDTPGKLLEISVADTGVGIAAADMPRLFEPFIPIDSSLSRHFEGTGLGLVMVRKLAELHDGAVAVSSLPGLGSTFTIWLPCRTAPVADAAAAPAAQAQPPANNKAPLVLVVDDDPKAVEIIAVHLEDSGNAVLRAYGGEECLQMALTHMPDLLVLDLMMPAVDGFEVVERMKGDPKTAAIPILVLTAKQLSDADRGLLNGGTLQVMEKSEFDHKNFIGEVHRVLGRKREQLTAA